MFRGDFQLTCLLVFARLQVEERTEKVAYQDGSSSRKQLSISVFDPEEQSKPSFSLRLSHARELN